MANLLARVETYTNAGGNGALFGDNAYKHVINQSDVGRELIVSLAATNITDTQLSAWIAYLTTSHGSAGTGDDAFTVAAVGTADGSAFVSGTTDAVILKLQGTGAFTDGTVEALTGTPTATILAVFTPAK